MKKQTNSELLGELGAALREATDGLLTLSRAFLVLDGELVIRGDSDVLDQVDAALERARTVRDELVRRGTCAADARRGA